MRIRLAECSAADLRLYCQERAPYVQRRELIFAAGALDNRILRPELGAAEQCQWDEGRRAANPYHINPYIP